MLPVLHLTTYYRKRSKLPFVHSDFVHHTGMVKAFLQYHKANFLSYVVGMYYCKMHRQLWDPLSIPYFQFIQDTVLSPSTFPHHQIFTPQSSRPKHLQNDWRFLKMLSKLEHLLQIKVPQLLVAIPATNETSPIMAYNQDTYMEYQLILSNLLEKFWLALDVLYELKDPHKKAFKDTMDGIVQVGDALQRWLGAVSSRSTWKLSH